MSSGSRAVNGGSRGVSGWAGGVAPALAATSCTFPPSSPAARAAQGAAGRLGAPRGQTRKPSRVYGTARSRQARFRTVLHVKVRSEQLQSSMRHE